MQTGGGVDEYPETADEDTLDTDLDIFRHAPLKSPANYVRLLRLLRLHPKTWNKPVKVELGQHTIAEAPVYEAVSYTWDHDRPPVPIIVNGKNATVSPSCEYALRQVRFEKSTRILWLDALCIN